MPSPPKTLLPAAHVSRKVLTLRSLHIPTALTSSFLELAHANTIRNVETCGVLAGVLTGGAFVTTHLFIPSQTGTSDTTDANEDELLEHMLQHPEKRPILRLLAPCLACLQQVHEELRALCSQQLQQPGLARFPQLQATKP